LLDAETGQRGYLLTNNPVYLQPYHAALSAIPADQQRLGSQVSAVPGGRQYFATLKSLVAAKLRVIAETIKLERAGDHAGAVRIVGTNAGKQIMDEARATTTASNATPLRQAPRAARTWYPADRLHYPGRRPGRR